MTTAPPDLEIPWQEVLCELPKRTVRALEDEGVITLRDLLKAVEAGLFPRRRNFGARSRQELYGAMAAAGLETPISVELPPPPPEPLIPRSMTIAEQVAAILLRAGK